MDAGIPLVLTCRRSRLLVSCAGLQIGHIPSPHAKWLRPLLGKGVRLQLRSIAQKKGVLQAQILILGSAEATSRLQMERQSR